MTQAEKKQARRRKHCCEFAHALGTIAVFLVMGTLVVHYNEVRPLETNVALKRLSRDIVPFPLKGIDWLTALYWSVVTCSSVGYGDVTINKEVDGAVP